jgi:hypothetical protein
VVGVVRVGAQVDLTRRTRHENSVSFGPRSSVTGVPLSEPRSVVSLAEKAVGAVASTRPSPTPSPSRYRLAFPLAEAAGVLWRTPGAPDGRTRLASAGGSFVGSAAQRLVQSVAWTRAPCLSTASVAVSIGARQ